MLLISILNTKVDKKSYKDMFICYKIKVNIPWYIDFKKINGYCEDDNRSKYQTLIPVNENKGTTINMYHKIYNKIKYIIESEGNDPSNNNDKYMKIRINLDDNLMLKKSWKCMVWC